MVWSKALYSEQKSVVIRARNVIKVAALFWVSRIGIVVLLFAAVWAFVSKKYKIRPERLRYHTIVHFDIPAKDVEKLRRFYTDLFGWRIEAWPEPGKEYWRIETVPGDGRLRTRNLGVNGGIGKKEKDEAPLNYISGESVDEYCEKIARLGGKITVPKQDFRGIGRYAIAIYPEGKPFAIMQFT